MENILKIFTVSHNSRKHNIKRIIVVSMFFLIFTSFVSLNAQWAKTYGGSDIDYPNSIDQTNDGGYIVAGETSSFGAGTHDICIIKLDSEGDIVWQKTYGGSDYDTAYSIDQTNDGGFVVSGKTRSFGAGGNDIWILKLSPGGDIEWQRTYGGSGSDWANCIQQTSDGGYVVAGVTDSFGDGGGYSWILKLSATGDIEWQYTYVGSAYSIQQTSDEGYIVAIRYGSDCIFLKLYQNGDIEWQRSYGSPDSEVAYSIQQTSDGGYIAAGSTSFGVGWFSGPNDFWVLKLSSVGDIEWQRSYGGNEHDWADSIQQTSDGGYIVAGETKSFGDDEWGDLWVLKLSSAGDIEWQRTYGGSKSDGPNSIQQTSDGGYIVAGDTDSFGSGVQDFLILKLSSDGDIDTSCGDFLGSSSAIITDTSVSPEDTFITPLNTNVIPQDTSVSPQNIYTIVTVICPIIEEDGGKDESDGGGLCFIATAAYGSPLHPHLDILRDFRDKYLMPSSLGRKFVSLYYKYSPFAANLIAKHKALKIVVRIYLAPLVAFSYSMLHFGPIIIGIMLAFIFMLSIVLISLFYRKLRRFQKKLPVPFFN